MFLKLMMIGGVDNSLENSSNGASNTNIMILIVVAIIICFCIGVYMFMSKKNDGSSSTLSSSNTASTPVMSIDPISAAEAYNKIVTIYNDNRNFQRRSNYTISFASMNDNLLQLSQVIFKDSLGNIIKYNESNIIAPPPTNNTTLNYIYDGNASARPFPNIFLSAPNFRDCQLDIFLSVLPATVIVYNSTTSPEVMKNIKILVSINNKFISQYTLSADLEQTFSISTDGKVTSNKPLTGEDLLKQNLLTQNFTMTKNSLYNPSAEANPGNPDWWRGLGMSYNNNDPRDCVKQCLDDPNCGGFDYLPTYNPPNACSFKDKNVKGFKLIPMDIGDAYVRK